MSGTQVLVAVLASTGFGAIVTALITGLFSKRKLGAEATQIIANAAASVASDLRVDLDRKSRDMAAMVAEHKRDRQEMQAAHEAEMAEVRELLRLHTEWDQIALEKIREFGVELPPVPPLPRD